MPSRFSMFPTTPARDRPSNSKKTSPRTPPTSAHTTPYTSSPFSGRSFSSTLSSPSPTKYSPRSPLYEKSKKSVADLTDNWRERAQLNGIKVTAVVTDQNTNEGEYMRLLPYIQPDGDQCIGIPLEHHLVVADNFLDCIL